LLNLRVASLLDLPYASSVFRAPFRRIMSSQALAAEEKLRVVEITKESAGKRAGARGTITGLPVFLAAVLSRIDNLEQFWPAVGQLRAEASALRRRRGDLEQTLADQGSKAQMRTEIQLAKAVAREAQTLSSQLRVPVAGAAAAFVAAAISGPAAAALAAIGALSLWEKMDAATYELLVARFRRPYEIFLNNVGEEAAAMHSGLPRIARIWQMPESSLAQHARFLERVGDVGLG
jgi:hypothetical protein